MTMKNKLIFLIVTAILHFCGFVVHAQEGSEVYNKLKQSFTFVRYEKETGGYIVELFIPKSKDCYYAYYDNDGKPIIPMDKKYTWISWNKDLQYFSVYLDDVITRDARNGYIDKYGNEVIPPTKYSTVWSWNKDAGSFVVKLGGKYGLVDRFGNEIVPPTRYTSIWWNKEIQAFKIEVGTKKGIMDKSGKEIVSPKYTSLQWNERENIFMVENGDKKGVVDKNGKEIISPTKYTYIATQNNHYIVSVGALKGIVSFDGREIVAPKYNSISFLYRKDEDSCGYYEVKVGQKIGLLNTEYKEVLAPVYDKWRWGFSNVICCYIYQQGSKKGLVDYTGKHILNSVDEIGEEKQGVRAFRKDELWGYVDIVTGKILYEPQFTSAGDFSEGMAKVSKGSLSFLVSINGETLSSVSLAQGKKSDIDDNIPQTNKVKENTFAVIIANQNYSKFVVAAAINDGTVFKEYCTKSLGIPSSNIIYYEDATLNNMRSAVSRIQDLADAYEGDAEIIFYFAGQGASDNAGKPYLVPSDGETNMISSTCHSTERLCKELGGLNTKYTLIIMDADFNNTDRNGKELFGDSNVPAKIKGLIPTGNLIVFAATSGNETAFLYEEKNHGLFTYFLCKYIQENKGDIDFDKWQNYIVANVGRISVNIGMSKQSPQIINHKNIKL